MRNNRLLPYETIVQAASGEPEAVGTVLQYYRRRIQCAARVNGRVDQDTEDYITQTLLTAIFQVPLLGRYALPPTTELTAASPATRKQ